MASELVVRGRVELPTFRFSGVADAQLRQDVLVVRGCLGLRQGADGLSALPSRLPSEIPADLPLSWRGVTIADNTLSKSVGVRSR
jgi:hypothetical protein